jgi:hypothetical protein
MSLALVSRVGAAVRTLCYGQYRLSTQNFEFVYFAKPKPLNRSVLKLAKLIALLMLPRMLQLSS